MSFPYREDEGECLTSIAQKTNHYKEAVRLIRKKLISLGYEVAEAVCKYDEKKRMRAIANLLARNDKRAIELACIIYFPKAKTSSVNRLLKRIEKISSAWELAGVYLCVSRGGKEGYGEFPMIADRILKKDPNVRVFNLDIDSEEMKPLFRWIEN